MERVVDIATDGLFLATHRGFLTVSAGGEEQGRIALDDIGALIVHAHGTVWSNSVMVRLSERAIPIVVCGSNHAPVACVWPLEGHHAQGARMRAQVGASKPLIKQIWRQVVGSKIRMQGHILAVHGKEAGAFDLLARKVRSGDPDNVEAQAARRYWKALFGPKFSRDRASDGANALLNYGYTVLRAVVSRAVCAAGLHPTIGVFHANRTNAFALSDDPRTMPPCSQAHSKMMSSRSALACPLKTLHDTWWRSSGAPETAAEDSERILQVTSFWSTEVVAGDAGSHEILSLTVL